MSNFVMTLDVDNDRGSNASDLKVLLTIEFFKKKRAKGGIEPVFCARTDCTAKQNSIGDQFALALSRTITIVEFQDLALRTSMMNSFKI